MRMCYQALQGTRPQLSPAPCVQGRLELQVAQLTEVLHALPHRRSVLAGPAADARRPVVATDPLSAIVGMLSVGLSEVGRGIMAVGEALMSTRASALREISRQGIEVRGARSLSRGPAGTALVHCAL